MKRCINAGLKKRLAKFSKDKSRKMGYIRIAKDV